MLCLVSSDINADDEANNTDMNEPIRKPILLETTAAEATESQIFPMLARRPDSVCGFQEDRHRNCRGLIFVFRILGGSDQ